MGGKRTRRGGTIIVQNVGAWGCENKPCGEWAGKEPPEVGTRIYKSYLERGQLLERKREKSGNSSRQGKRMKGFIRVFRPGN